MTLWMKVSNDIYELPEIVCGSLGELSYKTGIRKDKIRYTFYYAKKVGIPCQFVRVEVDDWTTEEEETFKKYFKEKRRAARKTSERRRTWKERYNEC